jgi:PPE-repeat protein
MPVVPGDFGATPPEVNYYTLVAGDHAASCEAAALAYEALSDAVTAEMAVMASNTTMTAAEGWKGLGGSAMLMTAGTFEGVLSAAVAWLNEAFGAATNIATAYHAAEAGMIPGQVVDVNRATQLGLVVTNWGQNTPAINALDAEYLHFWMQNAGWMGSFQSVVTAAMAVLATPPPLAPVTGDPAVPAAAAAQAAADPAIGALSQSAQGMTEAVGGGQMSQAATPAAAGGELMQSALPQVMSAAGQFPQLLSQAPQAVSSLPQMLGQSMGQFGGLLGPLSGATSLSGATPAELAPISTAGGSMAPVGGGAALNAFAGGAAAPSNGVLSAFTKPVNSFSPATSPKLPGAWRVPEEPIPAPVSASPGGGGLYGAPAAMSRESTGGQGQRTPTRTLQLTGHSTANRGDDPRN